MTSRSIIEEFTFCLSTPSHCLTPPTHSLPLVVLVAKKHSAHVFRSAYARERESLSAAFW